MMHVRRLALPFVLALAAPLALPRLARAQEGDDWRREVEERKRAIEEKLEQARRETQEKFERARREMEEQREQLEQRRRAVEAELRRREEEARRELEAWIAKRERGEKGEREEGRRGAAEDEKLEPFVKEHFPEWLEQLEQLKKERPDLYEQHKDRVRGEARELMQLARENPGEFERAKARKRLEVRAHALAESAKRAEGDARKKLESDLLATLQQLFDFALKDRLREAEEATAQAQKAKARAERFAQRRQELTERRLKEMLGGERDEEW